MLLAALLIDPWKTVSTDRLIDLLWGETPPAPARNSLQTYVARTRSELSRWRAAGRLTTYGSGYAMEVDPQEVDSVCFEHLLARARKADDPAQAAAVSGEALALWRGPRSRISLTAVRAKASPCAWESCGWKPFS